MLANFFLKMARRYLKDQYKFAPGDLAQHIENGRVYQVMGIYYSAYLQPFVFLRDNNGHVFAEPTMIYKPVSDVGVLLNAGD